MLNITRCGISTLYVVEGFCVLELVFFYVKFFVQIHPIQIFEPEFVRVLITIFKGYNFFFLQTLLNSQRTFVPGDHVAVPGTSEKISFDRNTW